MKTWLVLLMASSAVLATPAASAQPAGAPPKTLRLAYDFAETGFDPAQIGDNSSLSVTTHICEGLYGFDYLAPPGTVRWRQRARRRYRPTSAPGRSACAPAATSPTTRRSRVPRASWWRATSSTRSSAMPIRR